MLVSGWLVVWCRCSREMSGCWLVAHKSSSSVLCVSCVANCVTIPSQVVLGYDAECDQQASIVSSTVVPLNNVTFGTPLTEVPLYT